jgi:prophage regulatory protein
MVKRSKSICSTVIERKAAMAENLIRLSEVQRRVPYSRSTIYLKVARNEFPQPVSLGARAVAWVESEVDRWIDQRIEGERDGVEE